jgi:hypothetical protein
LQTIEVQFDPACRAGQVLVARRAQIVWRIQTGVVRQKGDPATPGCKHFINPTGYNLIAN